VQVLKKASCKYVLIHGVAAWPEHLQTIEFGYRITLQRSTGFRPYFLVYGRQPTYPAQIREMLDGSPVDVTSDAAMFLLITHRAQILSDAMSLAYERAVSAQQRHTVRFQRVRRRDAPPRLHHFQVGDYVYVAQKRINSLDVTTTRTILRVRAVRPNGVLELKGADGTVVRTRMELCAPCHIPHLVKDAVEVPADLTCPICGSPSTADLMLLCDRCDNGYHIHCLAPPLEQVLVGQWCCPRCQKS
jgi:hypothetical protein